MPLQIVDFFHPNHFAELTVGRPVLETLNAVSRISFTVLFLVIRTVWFPIVVFGLVRARAHRQTPPRQRKRLSGLDPPPPFWISVR